MENAKNGVLDSMKSSDTGSRGSGKRQKRLDGSCPPSELFLMVLRTASSEVISERWFESLKVPWNMMECSREWERNKSSLCTPTTVSPYDGISFKSVTE